MCIEYPSGDAPRAVEDAVFDLEAGGNARRKLWQLPSSCHCLIIGTCLKLSEVKALCKKCDYPTAGRSDYELHRFVVGQASYADSIIARRAHKMLESKYKVDVARLRGRQTDTTLLDHWNVLRDAGRVAGTLWAAVTHPDCSSEVISTIYGEVHMLSHLTGASVHKQAEELPGARRSIESLQRKIKTQHAALTHKIETGQEKIARLETLNAQLRQQLQQQADTSELTQINQIDHQIVRSALKETNTELRATRLRLDKAEHLVDEKNEAYSRLTEDNEKLERLIEFLTEKNEDKDGQCDKSLSGKCLLLLGGMPSQCKHFKAYVEANNGDFLHHDGGVESNISRIDNLISQADAVLCPVEQVSHSAMQRAKKVCKSTDKPLVFLPKSSLTAFVSGLRELDS
jgi:hypothetical protein